MTYSLFQFDITCECYLYPVLINPVCFDFPQTRGAMKCYDRGIGRKKSSCGIFERADTQRTIQSLDIIQTKRISYKGLIPQVRTSPYPFVMGNVGFGHFEELLIDLVRNAIFVPEPHHPRSHEVRFMKVL